MAAVTTRSSAQTPIKDLCSESETAALQYFDKLVDELQIPPFWATVGVFGGLGRALRFIARSGLPLLDVDIVACFVYIFLERHPGCTPLKEFLPVRKERYLEAGGREHEELARSFI